MITGLLFFTTHLYHLFCFRIAKADLGILVSFVKALPTLLADFKNVRPVTDRMSSFFPKSKFHSGGMPDESNRTDHFEDDMPMKTHKGMWGRVYAIQRRSQSFIKSVKFSSVLTPRQIHGPLIVAESFKFEENEQTTILQFIFFIFGIYNILDVLSFLPLFVDDLKPYVIIFRVFRLGRLYSIINDHYLNELLYNTLANSLEALVCIGIFSFFSVLLFSTLIYFTERGTFTVNVDYPNGAYLVPTVNDLGMQPTNFVSIPVSMYWAVTTLTTGTIVNELLLSSHCINFVVVSHVAMYRMLISRVRRFVPHYDCGTFHSCACHVHWSAGKPI